MSQRRWLATAVIFRPSDVFRFRRNVICCLFTHTHTAVFFCAVIVLLALCCAKWSVVDWVIMMLLLDSFYYFYPDTHTVTEPFSNFCKLVTGRSLLLHPVLVETVSCERLWRASWVLCTPGSLTNRRLTNNCGIRRGLVAGLHYKSPRCCLASFPVPSCETTPDQSQHRHFPTHQWQTNISLTYLNTNIYSVLNIFNNLYKH